MLNPHLNWKVLRDVSWWHWLTTVPLLAAHLSGGAGALTAAMILCAAMTGYYWLRLREIHPYPVQIRIAYFAILAIGMLPWMQWLLWIPLVGTTAMVTVGYCALHRALRLAPFNRIDPLSWSMVWRVFFRDRCAGGLVSWGRGRQELSSACCSLASAPSGGACSLPSSRSLKATSPHASTH